MIFDAATFRKILGHYPTGVCVVSAVTADGRPIGMTVGSFTSVSLEPPLVGFFPDRKSTSWAAIEAMGRFCVNILARDQDRLCRKFSAASADRFTDVVHRLSHHGSPILDGAVAWIDCTIHSVTETGDHLLVLGEVQAMAAQPSASPLVFLRGKLGHVIDIEVSRP
ncbi:flavin reductase family protein [Novosphingobium resinovorum]|uniref:flavin reductase family protein n=1 Tax=Novosphingobium resinovorum TaxID=158500 RepID=UPI002ED06469|nr:flavin reductase family protein [Novosphingobium resinovorum]